MQQIIHILFSSSKYSVFYDYVVETRDHGNMMLFDFFWFLQKRNISMVFKCIKKKKEIAFDSSAEMTVIAVEKSSFEWDNAVAILCVTISTRREDEKWRWLAAVTSSEVPSRPRLASQSWFIAVGTGDRVRRPRGLRSNRRTRDFPW